MSTDKTGAPSRIKVGHEVKVHGDPVWRGSVLAIQDDAVTVIDLTLETVWQGPLAAVSAAVEEQWLAWPRFHYPPSDIARAWIGQFLGSGTSIVIGLVSLHPDAANGLIWGSDAYGCDAIAGQDVHRALAWVSRQHDPDTRHPAESGGGPTAAPPPIIAYPMRPLNP